MLTAISPNILHQFDQAIHYEWLETNGLGGYASSTVIGAHTRRYHGLLVAAVNPPVGRAVMLSRLDETIHVEDRVHELSTNKYCGAIHPNGYIYLSAFERGLFPTFTYQVEDIKIRKTVVGIQEENTVVILYEMLEGNLPIRLSLKPLYNPRDYHALGKRSTSINTAYTFEGDTFYTLAQPSLGPLFIHVPDASFAPDPHWYFNFEFPEEQERGMEAVEDLFTPGQFELSLQKGQCVGIIVSTEPPAGRNAIELYEAEKVRRLALIQKGPGKSSLVDRLTLAADQFIVKRNENQKTIIAGYHWFTDWGRDTMIALPGLCLANQRFDDAKKILQAFGAHTNQGMIPNRFPDYQDEPEYNNIDATLWFFVAIYKYYQATQDLDFIKDEMLPILGSILEWHERGTRYNIRMDNDGLLSGGEEGT
ncbi:MAG: glycogen debranching enzyme N-terminal domain-containing protein, partial [Bacteroidota bacterium]